MKAQKLPLLISLLLVAGSNACEPGPGRKDINCTEEFRTVGVKISGEPLSDYYTIRLSTSDTIRAKPGIEPSSGWYWILDDSYKELLKNRKEVFRFIGKRGNATVVDEEYLIEADHCHINKVSGKDEI
ncbi:hypothetical protein [Dyadobacter aurulentus]|uniref:hypothetical protein n=1 Tax=Dyadobacter sp. UC 10 TaxID=2605428 RepID=UPI0011F20ECB|nr:hypothetical protein [Dyadobacter sp. UC 10]KAA0992607.1 hypothetical protein FXO21_21755 [Dyadobacter sp. UC 10]